MSERFLLFPLYICLFMIACGERDRDTIPGEQRQEVEEKAPDTLSMNDSIWRQDSILVWKLWEQYWFYDDNYRRDSAIATCEQIIEIGQPMMQYQYDSTIYEKYAKAYGGIGFNLITKGRFKEGLEWTKKSYQLVTEKFGEIHIRNAELCTSFIGYYLEVGDYEQALRYCNKSLKIRREYFPDLHYYVGNVFNVFAILHLKQGDYATAINYYHKAIDVYRQTKPINLLEVNYRLCEVHLLNNDPIKAKASAEECIRLAKLGHGSQKIVYSDGNFDLARVYIKYGIVNRELGDLDGSIAKIQTGIEMAQKRWETAGDIMASGYLELGKTLAEKGEWKKAIQYYQKVPPIIEKYAGRGKEQFIDAFIETASTYQRYHQFDSALIYYQKALHFIAPAFSAKDYLSTPKASALMPFPYLLEIMNLKANTLRAYYQQTGRSKYLLESFHTYQLAVELINKMRHGYKWEKSKQDLSENAFPIFQGAIDAALKLGKLETAFRFAENSKAFLLIEHFTKEKARSTAFIPDELKKSEERVLREMSTYKRLILEERIAQNKPDTSKMVYWNNKLLELKTQHDSIVQILERDFPDYFQLKYEIRTTATKEVRAALNTNEMLIEYFLGDSILYTFTIDQSGLDIHKQRIDSTFFRAVERLQDLIHKNSNEVTWVENFGQFTRDSRYLYQCLLVHPLEKRSTSTSVPSSLVIVADGILNFIPFNILLAENPSLQTMAQYDYRSLPYLMQEVDLRYEYSASLMAVNQKPTPWYARLNWLKKTPVYLGFAPAYQSGSVFTSRGTADSLLLFDLYPILQRGTLGALIHNQPEVLSVAKTIGGQPLIGPAASEASFKSLAPKADILHLAMHALTNDEDPLFSQLAFEQTEGDSLEDGRLHAYELYDIRLNANLAVLSACNTGAGKLQRGEGVMSLSRAFKYAGVPNIVMSLWTANDASTRTIISSFFENLKDGWGKDAALCASQRHFLETTSQQYTHPYYWSTMVLIGDAAPMYASSNYWLRMICLVFLLLVSGYFLYKIFTRRSDSLSA